MKQVETISMRVQKELVLLHRQDVAHPTGTVRWLNALGWLSSYFHVRGGSRRGRRGEESRGRRGRVCRAEAKPIVTVAVTLCVTLSL